jgi:transposase
VLICDVEGYETTLLDPLLIDQLRGISILVELHEFAQRGISAVIRERFTRTHSITEFVSTSRTWADFPQPGWLCRQLPRTLAIRAMNEARPETMTWFWMVPHHLSREQNERLAAYLQQFPALEQVYRFKQKLCYLLLEKHQNQQRCRKLAPRLLRMIADLRQAGLAQLVQLGNTLHAWKEEIATMWRFTRNNGITEGFHTKMEVLQRQAYGFRNFNNYWLRVKVLCS